MWKRDEAVKPAGGQTTPGVPAVQQSGARRQTERDTVNIQTDIGKSVIVKGELSGSEDLTIEGKVEGKIELKDHVLTVGSNGKVKAQVFAKSVVVIGEINGNVTSTEKVEIRDGGSVDGDIMSPRVSISEGAHFRGSIDMPKTTSAGAPPQMPSRGQHVEAR